MKNLIVPKKQEDSISLAEITEDYKCLIIVYNDENPIGYIQYVSGDWNFYRSIDGEEYNVSHNILFETIDEIENMFSTNITFKVLEFVC